MVCKAYSAHIKTTQVRKYTWLLFDLDNTILDFGASSKAAFFDVLAKYELSQKDYDLYNGINHAVWVEFEKGQMTQDTLKIERWRRFGLERGLELDPTETNEAYFHHIRDNPIYVPGADLLIEDCLQEYQLAIITNGLSEVQESRLALTGLRDKIEHIIISDQIGVAKPAEAFFQYTYKKIGEPLLEDVLVIGDTLTSDIRGGLDFGTDTCWYNYYGKENHTTYRPTYEVKNMKGLRDLLL